MPEPSVTVVIPVLNGERFIARTIRSVLSQTYNDFELLIINDGSTDNTRSVASHAIAGDHRCRIIDRANGGLSRARNLGIREAAGEFVAFIDADDLWHPTKLALQVEALRDPAGHNAAAVYAFFRAIDTDDRALMPTDDRPYIEGYILARHLYGRLVGNGSALMVRRSIAIAAGGFDPECDRLGGCEDWDFELQLARRNPIRVVPLYLVGYRMYPGNMSSDPTKMCRSVLAITARHLAANPQLPAWVPNRVCAATNEYVLGILLERSLWTDIAKRLPSLFRCEPSRGLSFLVRLLVRLARDLSSRLKPTPSKHTLLPLFHELDTAARPVDESRERRLMNRRRRDREILASLAPVDAKLQAELQTEPFATATSTIFSARC